MKPTDSARKKRRSDIVSARFMIGGSKLNKRRQ